MITPPNTPHKNRIHIMHPIVNDTLRLGAGVLLALGFVTSDASAQLGSASGDLNLPGAPGVPGFGEPGGPGKPLSAAEKRVWLKGRDVYDRNFNPANGLGFPEFNADSCRACHQDPVLGGAGGLELNVARFGHDGGGLEPFVDLPGGQAASKLRPAPDATRENYPVDNPDPSQNADVFEQRQTPTNFGIGLLDQVTDTEILSHEDPFDLDGDGIRGVARILMVNGQPEVGRFGWKGQIPHVADFVRDAMAGECGITTPDDGRGFGVSTDGDAVADPELSVKDRDALVFFLQNLGAPIGKPVKNAEELAGQAVFVALRCDRCHLPFLELPNGNRVNALTDLLLHDVMGPGFRGMSEPGAPSGTFRTPPLWGVKDTAPYMHDGRAATLEEAVQAHHGEAEFSSLGYAALDAASQANLVAFLKSL